MEQNHLSAAEMAGFIDHTLDDEVRARAAEHLATCERCRDEVAACARLAASAPAAVTRPVTWRIVLGLAAVLVITVALRSGWRARSPMGRERNVAAERSAPITSRITTVFPADSVPIARSRLRFVWEGDARASAYSLAITDANGKPVYSVDETSDTTFALPDTVRLTPSVVYFWHVDAPHADGSSARSSSVPFRIAP